MGNKGIVTFSGSTDFIRFATFGEVNRRRLAGHAALFSSHVGMAVYTLCCALKRDL